MTFKVSVMVVSVVLVLIAGMGCTVAETAVTPTATAVIIVESVDTPTPQPTATFQPTSTTTATPLPIATSTPMPEPTDVETPLPTPTTWIIVTSVSPDGNWVATSSQGVLEDAQQLSAVLQVSSADQEWIADIVTEQNVWGVIDAPIPLSWTTDEQFLFFTYEAFSDGCFSQRNGWEVYRLDLTTGIVEEITAKPSQWYAPSPDGKHLAYVSKYMFSWWIVLRDIETGTEQEIHLDLESAYPDIAILSLMWSPANNALLVTASVGECVSLEPLDFLIHIDLKTLDQITLFDQQVGAVLRMIEWTASEKALLQLYDGKFVWVNILTGELTPAEE